VPPVIPVQAPPLQGGPKGKLSVFARIVLVCVGLFAAFFVFRIVQAAISFSKHPFIGSRGEHAFHKADLQIVSDDSGIAFGNSARAVTLAQEYSRTLKVLRTALFTKEDTNALSITHGEFVTYCHLDESNCVFLVHVPQLRDFDEDAKKSLEDLAWMDAQMVVQTNFASFPGSLVVGVKGAIFYDTIMVGDYLPESEHIPDGKGIKTRAGLEGVKLLYPYFASEEATNVAPSQNNP
jgi:hypothetical protein